MKCRETVRRLLSKGTLFEKGVAEVKFYIKCELSRYEENGYGGDYLFSIGILGGWENNL